MVFRLSELIYKGHGGAVIRYFLQCSEVAAPGSTADSCRAPGLCWQMPPNELHKGI